MRSAGAAVLGLVAALAAMASADSACSVIRLDADAPVWRACFEEPTRRYGHDVIGGPEWAALTLTGPGTPMLRARLPETRVFEDMAPRLVHLFGTGRPSVVVVESGVSEGAQLAIYAPERARLVKIAATPAIGHAFRWLAPAGIGDLDGDGAPEIALVAMPHLVGQLEIWGFAAGGLTREAQARGFSNHRIGDPRIVGGVRDCGGGPEIVLPDFGWRRVMAVRHAADGLAAREVADIDALADALACTDATR